MGVQHRLIMLDAHFDFMYYLYKISFKKYNYIGVTNDAIARKWQHFAVIRRLLICLAGKTTPYFQSNPAQRKFAELLLPRIKYNTEIEAKIYKLCVFTVLRRTKTQKEVERLETLYLKKADDYNLNFYKESFYKREVMIKEKPYVIRGNQKLQTPCIVKITYGNRYVIAKCKLQSAGLKRIEDNVNSFIRGGKNNPDGLYYFFLNYIKRQPGHKFKVQTLLASENAYELLKREQEELEKGFQSKKIMNNQAQAYIPNYNEEKEMYGGWIPQIAVLNFNNWLKKRKKAKKTAV